MLTLKDLQDSPYLWVQARANKILLREACNPWVWCAEFRHRRRLTNVNTGKPCPWCRKETERAGD